MQMGKLRRPVRGHTTAGQDALMGLQAQWSPACFSVSPTKPLCLPGLLSLSLLFCATQVWRVPPTRSELTLPRPHARPRASSSLWPTGTPSTGPWRSSSTPAVLCRPPRCLWEMEGLILWDTDRGPLTQGPARERGGVHGRGGETTHSPPEKRSPGWWN